MSSDEKVGGYRGGKPASEMGPPMKVPSAKMVAVRSEGVVVHPGDTLLVRVSRDTPLDQVHHLKNQLVEQLPDVSVLVVACEQLAAVRGQKFGGAA